MAGDAPIAPGGTTAGDPAPAGPAHGFEDPTYGPAFWIGLVVGGAVMAYAVWGAASDFAPNERTGLATWLLGSALAHDAVLAPVVTVVGLVLAWVLPRSVRGPVLGAFALSGMVLLFSWSSLRGFGRRDVNPSILPHDYGRNVALVIGTIWAVAAALVLVRVVRGRRAGRR